MTLTQFNRLNKNEARQLFFNCCGSSKWCEQLILNIPFTSLEELKNLSDISWSQCELADVLEAFGHHPKIGNIKSLEEKFATTKEWASGEQSGVNEASAEVLRELADGNAAYEKKFGYIFIVCATGRSAPEMLSLLQSRLSNQPEEEIKIAKQEQNKITHIRLDKLFS